MAEIENSRQEPVISATNEQTLPAQVQLINHDNSVVLTDINIPFSRAVSIMVKWMLAAIPAVILATIIVCAFILFVGFIVLPLFGIDLATHLS